MKLARIKVFLCGQIALCGRFQLGFRGDFAGDSWRGFVLDCWMKKRCEMERWDGWKLTAPPPAAPSYVRFTLLVFATDCIFIPFIHKIHEICTLTHAYFIIIKAHGKSVWGKLGECIAELAVSCPRVSYPGIPYTLYTIPYILSPTPYPCSMAKTKDAGERTRWVWIGTDSWHPLGSQTAGTSQDRPGPPRMPPAPAVNLYTCAQVGNLLTLLLCCRASSTWHMANRFSRPPTPSASVEDVDADADVDVDVACVTRLA